MVHDARMMDINHHHFLHFENDEVLRILIKLNKKVNTLMATIQELTAAVQRNTDIDDSVIALLNGIVQQLKDAQAMNDPAAIDALIVKLDANTAKMAEAVTANTPSNPFPTPPTA